MSPRRPHQPSPADGECCVHHPFERAERVCRDCGHWLCDQCIVTPWGPRKAALCVDCAIGRGGVRTTASRAPVRSEREIRKLERQTRDDVDGPLSAASAAALHRAAPAAGRDDAEPSRRSRFRRLRPSP
ncbi:MAG TPA: B-box zinc finger protein [Acidimicrobiales bacterium]|nr:B-box zinc finger protein [Acidimicrobiales bacterium]